jgi:hypothetical protein
MGAHTLQQFGLALRVGGLRCVGCGDIFHTPNFRFA